MSEEEYYQLGHGHGIDADMVDGLHAKEIEMKARRWSGGGPEAGLPCNYLIFMEGNIVKAINGSTGKVQFSGTDASTVIQSAINAIKTAGAGSMHLKNANYILNTKILIDFRHISIDADPGTIFSSNLLPCFEISGTLLDGDESVVVYDVQVSNIKFLYTGTVTTGNFILLSKLQSDYKFQGEISLNNIKIRSSEPATQAGIPTDDTFIGLKITDIVGATYNRLSVAGFGIGVKYVASDYQGSHNVFYYPSIAFCRIGALYTGNAWGTTAETWINPKIMYCSAFGLLSDPEIPGELTLISPQFENAPYRDNPALDGWALYFRGHSLYVENGLFSYVNNGLLAFVASSPNNSTATIMNCYFDNMYSTKKAIHAGKPITVINSYFTPDLAAPVDFEDTGHIKGWGNRWGANAYLTENSGTSTGTGAQQTIPHGCAFTPTYDQVFLSERSTGGALAYQSATPDATNIYVTATNLKTYNWQVSKNP